MVRLGMPRKQPLTKPQAGILQFVRAFLKTRGFPPTRIEISNYFGWASRNAAQQQLRAIERKGWIKISHMTSRGISVL